MSLGYPIHVFQESINQYIQEYLVNFPYLIRIIENYGFVQVTKEEAKHMGLPDSSGMFSELFNMMELEINGNSNRAANYRKASYMSPEEKRISFMNRYFVFKKVRSVDAKKLEEILLKEQALTGKIMEEGIKEVEEYVEERMSEETAPIIKKKQRLVIRRPPQQKEKEPEKPKEEPKKQEEEQKGPVFTGKKITLKIKK